MQEIFFIGHECHHICTIFPAGIDSLEIFDFHNEKSRSLLETHYIDIINWMTLCPRLKSITFPIDFDSLAAEEWHNLFQILWKSVPNIEQLSIHDRDERNESLLSPDLCTVTTVSTDEFPVHLNQTDLRLPDLGDCLHLVRLGVVPKFNHLVSWDPFPQKAISMLPCCTSLKRFMVLFSGGDEEWQKKFVADFQNGFLELARVAVLCCVVLASVFDASFLYPSVEKNEKLF